MIVIDGFPLLFLPGGIKSYLIALIKALDASDSTGKSKYIILIPEVDRTLSAFHTGEAQELERTLSAKFRFQCIKMPRLLFYVCRLINAKDPFIRRVALFLWENIYLPKEVKKLQPKVVLHPYQVMANYKTSAKKVVVIHDVNHWTLDLAYSFIVKYMYDSYKVGCKNADTILTISETSKKEIVKYLDIPEDKVIVVYEGVDDMYLQQHTSTEKEKEFKEFYQLPKKYIFAQASLREYKNTQAVLEIFLKLVQDGSSLKLVLLGWCLASESYINAFIKKNKLEESIILIPKLRNSEEIVQLYKFSYIFLFLSENEGFGLPPLEATASSTLAIVSNVSSVGELYNNILPSFDPADYQGVREYILALTDAKREKAISSAKERLLSKYTWEDVLPNYLTYLT